MKRGPVDSEVEVISIEDDSDPEGTGTIFENGYQITMNPIESEEEDTGPISDGQPSLHPTGLFVNKTPSQDAVTMATDGKNGTRPLPTVLSAPTGQYRPEALLNCRLHR